MKKYEAIALMGLLTLGMSGCDADPAGSDSAQVKVLLTDAPGDFTSAQVKIEQIYLLPSASDDENGEKIVLYKGGGTFNLLDLRNGVTAELATVTIPAGTYNQVRIVISEATITTKGGTTYSTASNTLQCPSCAQSGLKLKLGGGGVTIADGQQGLLIDFDVAQSFGRAAGNSGRWVMSPVIRATRIENSGSITGTVTLRSGVTLPSCGGAAVTLSHFAPTATSGEVVVTGHTTGAGALKFSFTGPGTYTFGANQVITFDNGNRLTFTATPSVTSAVVAAGATVDVDYLVTGATCATS